MSDPDINIHILTGTVCNQPDLRFTQSGTAKLTFRLETGRPQPDGRIFTDRHNVVLWGKRAESMRELSEGERVHIAGEVRTRSYESGDGKKWITETNANTINWNGAATKEHQGQQQQQQPPPRPRPTPPKSAYRPPAEKPVFYSDDEDIPF
jgi:single-strand DNA-binding protein